MFSSLDSPDLRDRRQCCVSAIIASAIARHDAGDWPIPKSGKSPLKPAHPRYPSPWYSPTDVFRVTASAAWRRRLRQRHFGDRRSVSRCATSPRRPPCSVAAEGVRNVRTCCNLLLGKQRCDLLRAVTYIHTVYLCVNCDHPLRRRRTCCCCCRARARQTLYLFN